MPSDEKESPYYRLDEVRDCVRRGKYRVRTQALQTARDELGLDSQGICGLLLALTEDDFHKSMNSANIRGMVLDVYRPVITDLGLQAYVKIGIDDRRGELLIVFSCKEK